MAVLSVRLGRSRGSPGCAKLPEQLGFPFGSPTALLEHSGFEGAVAGAESGGGGRSARSAAAGILRLGPVRGLDTTPRNLAWFVMGSIRERRKEGTIGMILTIGVATSVEAQGRGKLCRCSPETASGRSQVLGRVGGRGYLQV